MNLNGRDSIKLGCGKHVPNPIHSWGLAWILAKVQSCLGFGYGLQMIPCGQSKWLRARTF